MRRYTRSIVVAAALAFDAGHSAPGSEQAHPTGFAERIQPILDANCVACHQTGSAQQGLVLEAGLTSRCTGAAPRCLWEAPSRPTICKRSLNGFASAPITTDRLRYLRQQARVWMHDSLVPALPLRAYRIAYVIRGCSGGQEGRLWAG